VHLSPSTGIVGALIGDWLLHRLGLHFGAGIIGLVINATIGAIVLLLVCIPNGAVTGDEARTRRRLETRAVERTIP